MESKNNKSYRIRTTPGNGDTKLNIKLEQDFELLETLSLKLSQEDVYKLQSSDKGVLVGRVLANEGFGIPNVKVSIFIPVSEETKSYYEKYQLYPYASSTDKNSDEIRYNLLTDQKLNECYQVVGNFPNKRFMLDNNLLLEIFDEYYKFTTVTNNAGDYMIYGISTGNHILHIDMDLSDIGVLSQKPRDMVYKGYNMEQFDSPSMFKTSTNLNSLSQIYSEDKNVMIYPFWGDPNIDEIAISRADINIQYKFEPTCVFMGSIFTDNQENAVLKNCKPQKKMGLMKNLISGEGTIEMIRKTFDGNIEAFQIKGNRLIDGNGVWCYQIPMNLDYVVTDEFGNMIPTDNPKKGIPTRTEARFRISLDNNGGGSKRRGVFLVPHNPQNPEEEDFAFDESCKDTSFRTLFWNKVYSVKNYVGRIQLTDNAKSRDFLGIKTINEFNQNNPVPYNNLYLTLPIVFSLLCALTSFIIYLISFLNFVLGLIVSVVGIPPLCLKLPLGIGKVCIPGFSNGWYPLKGVINCLSIGEGWCENDTIKYFPGCGTFMGEHFKITVPIIGTNILNLGIIWEGTQKSNGCGKGDVTCSEDISNLQSCVANSLANNSGVINFDFYNDWLNGSLFAPLFQIKEKKKKRRKFFGLFGSKVIGVTTQFCGIRDNDLSNIAAESGGTFSRGYGSLRLWQNCSLRLKKDSDKWLYEGNNSDCKNSKANCYRQSNEMPMSYGIVNMETDKNENIFYYYRPSNFDTKTNLPIYITSTDIILLGGLNDCDPDGIPPLHQLLPSSTYSMPPNVRIDQNDDNGYNPETPNQNDGNKVLTEVTGVDWNAQWPSDYGKAGTDQNNAGYDSNAGGLFLGVQCFQTFTAPKSCVNASRVCEVGVTLDERFGRDRNCHWDEVVPDGYIAKEELEDTEVRQMFATLNANPLNNLIINEDGFYKYNLNYYYPENFDGRIVKGMSGYIPPSESFDNYYYNFRMGEKSNLEYYVSSDFTPSQGINTYSRGSGLAFPRYNNSFYFYFGIKSGQTAIDKFNSEFYSPCVNIIKDDFIVIPSVKQNATICPCDNSKAKPILVNVTVREAVLPYSIQLESLSLNTILPIDDENIKEGVEEITFNLSDKTDSSNPSNTFIVKGLTSGKYRLTITDSSNNEVTQEFEIKALNIISFNLDYINPIGNISNNPSVKCDCGNSNISNNCKDGNYSSACSPHPYFGVQSDDDKSTKGMLILNNILNYEDKGCTLNNYKLIINKTRNIISENMFIGVSGVTTYTKSANGLVQDINGSDISSGSIQENVQYYIRSTGNEVATVTYNKVTYYSKGIECDFEYSSDDTGGWPNLATHLINGSIQIPACYGTYVVTLQHKDCTEDSFSRTVSLVEPSELIFIINDIDVNRFIYKKDGSVRNTYSDNYWYDMFKILYENMDEKLSDDYFTYPEPSEDETEDDVAYSYNQNIKSMVMKICPDDGFISLNGSGGTIPYQTYLVGKRNMGLTGENVDIYAQPSSFDEDVEQQAPYYTNVSIIDGQYITSPKEEPIGIQVSYSSDYCLEEHGGYYTALVDNNGYGSGRPEGLNTYIGNNRDTITENGLTLNIFNGIKGDNFNGKPASLFFHVFDKMLKEDYSRRRNNSFIFYDRKYVNWDLKEIESGNLKIGNSYVVVSPDDSTIIYNNKTYKNGDIFTATIVSIFSGEGDVKLYQMSYEFSGNVEVFIYNGVAVNEDEEDENQPFEILPSSVLLDNKLIGLTSWLYGTNLTSLPSIRRIKVWDGDVNNGILPVGETIIEGVVIEARNLIINYGLDVYDRVYSCDYHIDSNLMIGIDVTKTKTYWNELNDSKRQIGFNLVNSGNYNKGESDYRYYLISGNLTDIKGNKNPEKIVREYFVENVSDCPSLTATDPNITANGFIGNISSKEIVTGDDSVIFEDTDINNNNIYYVIVVDKNNDKTFSQVVDMRKSFSGFTKERMNVNIYNIGITYQTNGDDLDQLYMFNKYTYTLQQGKFSTNTWINKSAQEISAKSVLFENVTLDDTDLDLMTRIVVEDKAGLKSYYYFSIYKQIDDTDITCGECKNIGTNLAPIWRNTYNVNIISGNLINGDEENITTSSETYNNQLPNEIKDLASNGSQIILNLPECDPC